MVYLLKYAHTSETIVHFNNVNAGVFLQVPMRQLNSEIKAAINANGAAATVEVTIMAHKPQ